MVDEDIGLWGLTKAIKSVVASLRVSVESDYLFSVVNGHIFVFSENLWICTGSPAPGFGARDVACYLARECLHLRNV